MSKKCEVCGKGPQYGHNVSHSKRRTNRRFMPNLQNGKLLRGGQTVRLRMCTRCLRSAGSR